MMEVYQVDKLRNPLDRLRKNFSKEIKDQVVQHLIRGEYFVEELMEMYGISSRDMIIHWLSDYVRKQQQQSSLS